MAQNTGTLTLVLQEEQRGRCRAVVTDVDGNVLLDRSYKNKRSADAAVRQWAKKRGLGSVRIALGDDEQDEDDTPEEAPSAEPVPAPSLPADRWLLKLRTEAQKVLDEALKLRERADRLELEHKRLTAAADVLEGPEA